MLSTLKKTKTDIENWQFNTTWTIKNVYTLPVRPLYLLCREYTSIAKEYNVQRHVKMKPPIIKEIICCVQMDAEQKNDTWTEHYDHSCIVFSCLCSAHERATAASVWVTWILGKKKTLLTDSETVKYMLSAVEEAVTINWETRWCHA